MQLDSLAEIANAYSYLPSSTSSFFFFNFIVTFYYRVEAVCPRVAELNPYVRVDMSCSLLDSNTDLSFLRKYQVSRLWLC